MRRLPKISAIIVALNEELLICQIIHELRQQDYPVDLEIILADGGSQDRTVERARDMGIKVVVAPKRGKSIQMNAAAQVAQGDVLFFVHADMQLPQGVLKAIAEAWDTGFGGGGFANIFDSHNDRIKRLGTWMNFRFRDRREQSDRGIFYGDNGMFVSKQAFWDLNGFREIPIMEDYDFSRRLSRSYLTLKIKEPAIRVSARRHIKAGFIKTRLQWILIRKLFQWGVSPYRLARLYKDIR